MKMKGVAFALIGLIVGTLASPALPVVYDDNGGDHRFIVAGQVRKAVEQVAQSIRDAGLDPYHFEGSAQYELPVPVLFAAEAFVEALSFTGLSNIVVNRVNYNAITNRLTFNISLPRISFQIANSGFATIFFGDDFDGAFSGSLDIVQPRIIGNIRVSIGLLGSVTVRSMSFEFSLGGIESQLNLKIFGFELSRGVNTYLGITLPGLIREYAKEINELIEKLAWTAVNNN